MQADSAPGRPDHNISMWGAPSSGKTTLLAALYIALTNADDDWNIIGADPASSEFLIEQTSKLSNGKLFPEATVRALERYRWVLMGPARQNGRWGRKSKRAAPIEIGINMIDAPGGWFGADQRLPGAEALMENLVQSRGIVFLFDPIREFKVGDAFDHLHGPLTRLTEKMLSARQLDGGKLPHHIAICITKFDDLRVLETAEKHGLLAPDPGDPHQFPRVSSDDARDLFQELCAVSASGTADMALRALNKHFHQDRIRFFVTSSIGFYVDRRAGVFDWNDFENLLPVDAEGEVRIRGQVHPINVVEPMLWLARRLAG